VGPLFSATEGGLGETVVGLVAMGGGGGPRGGAEQLGTIDELDVRCVDARASTATRGAGV